MKNYIKNCEAGACMAVQEHAWMTKELFLNWLQHFASSIPSGVSPSNRALLIFDGHGSHVAYNTIEEARRLGIDLVTLPAHTSHKLQPLDVSVFSPFKNYFKQQRSKWMSNNPNIEIGREELATIASMTFKQALTPANIISGFRRTGIWPLNRSALQNDMRPSEAFDVTEDTQTWGTEADATTMEEQPEHMTAEACLRLYGYSEEQIDQFVHSYNEDIQGTQATTEGVASPPQIVDPCIDMSTLDGLSLPTQATEPDHLREAANDIGVQTNFMNDEVTLSMPTQPEIDPEDVIHYFTNASNWVNEGAANSEEEEPISDEEIVPCKQADG